MPQRSYHGIVVAVDHDGTSASKVDVLFPPVTYLWKRKYERYIQILLLTEHCTLNCQQN